MGDEEKQVDGGAGGEMQELTLVVGGLVCQGVVNVTQVPVTEDRCSKARGGASIGGRGRKPGSRHESLTVRVIEALMDKQFRRGEIEAALSGRCACPKRTLSDITKRIREQRNAKIVAEAVARAKAAQRAREEAEEEARLAASINQSWKTFGSR